ncbi:MAG: hypothetical protein Ta2A_06450 [Treponemataceae bacterium]|nr:MAG: hypothetical protein Ta2A_06450 [Treponemataceae bacterium]
MRGKTCKNVFLTLFLLAPAIGFYACASTDLGYFDEYSERNVQLKITKDLTIIAFDEALVDWKTQGKFDSAAVVFVPAGTHSLTVAWTEAASRLDEYGQIDYRDYKTANIVYTFSTKKKYRLVQRRYWLFPAYVPLGPEIVASDNAK